MLWIHFTHLLAPDWLLRVPSEGVLLAVHPSEQIETEREDSENENGVPV